MKKIYLLAAAFSFAALTGCSDFLDQDLKSNVPGAEYYGTDKGFESLTYAAYSSLRTLYGGDPWLFEGGADLFATGRTSAANCALYGTSFSSADATVKTFYEDHYKAISLANEVIYWAGDNASRASKVAEARGLRALYYLNLVQQFGGVPMVTERTSSILPSAERASAEDVYTFVINELSDISNSSALAAKATDGNKQQAHFCSYLDGQEKGHKYTSSTLTPTLWMHEVFAANTDNPAQDERYEATFMTELRQSYWDFYDEEKKDVSPVTYYYCPSWEIDNVDAWRAALPSRADAIVVEMLPEGNNIGNIKTSYESKMKEDVYGVASFRKFDDTENGKKVFSQTSSMRDIYLARLAETNLIAAEACIKANDPAGAVTYVNIVRSRAKATPATAAEMSIDYILNERARELAGEDCRWTDLTRTGKLAEYTEKYNPDISAGRITSKFYLRPIPLAAIELNPALEGHQNEGW